MATATEDSITTLVRLLDVNMRFTKDDGSIGKVYVSQSWYDRELLKNYDAQITVGLATSLDRKIGFSASKRLTVDSPRINLWSIEKPGAEESGRRIRDKMRQEIKRILREKRTKPNLTEYTFWNLGTTSITHKAHETTSVLETSPEAAVSPNTVAETSATYPLQYNFQRNSFYANGRFWVFYCDGANILFKSSTNGTTWTSATTLKAGIYAWRLSIFFDGTYLHYCFSSEADNSPILYRRGTPNSDGTITWTAAEQTALAGASGVTYYYPQITVDSADYPWIAYYRYGGAGARYPYVTKSSKNDGTWTTAANFPYQLNATNTIWAQAIVPLTNQKVLALYAKTAAQIYAKAWDGSQWGTEINTTSSAQSELYFSAVNEGDDVHLVFLKKTTYDIIYVKYTYSTNSFGSEVTVQAGASSTSAPSLSKNSSVFLYCFWINSNHVYYKKCVSGTWDTNPTDWINESTDGINDNTRVPCFYEAYQTYIGVTYRSKTSSLYKVRFAAFKALGEREPSPDDSGWSELATAGYGKIWYSDNERHSKSTSVNLKYPMLLFRFKIDIKTNVITKIQFNFEGYGTAPGGNGSTIKVWNFTSEAWESTQTGSGSGDETVTITLTSSLANYVDEDGYLYFLARTTNPSNGSTAAIIYCDYPECEITVQGIVYADVVSHRDEDQINLKPVVWRTEFIVTTWLFETVTVT